MKMHRFLNGVAVVALALLGAVACQDVNSTERAYPQGKPQFVNDYRIVTDSFLNVKAGIVSVNESRTSANMLQIQVRLLNRTNWPARFRYTFEWYDAKGMLLPTPALWTERRIMAGETVMIVGVAHHADAVDFRFKIVEKD